MEGIYIIFGIILILGLPSAIIDFNYLKWFQRKGKLRISFPLLRILGAFEAIYIISTIGFFYGLTRISTDSVDGSPYIFMFLFYAPLFSALVHTLLYGFLRFKKYLQISVASSLVSGILIAFYEGILRIVLTILLWVSVIAIFGITK